MEDTRSRWTWVQFQTTWENGQPGDDLLAYTLANEKDTL
jgi:hypothetical protein